MSIADHGILSLWLHLDFGGSGQGFGGWALCGTGDRAINPSDKNYGGAWIVRVLEIAGVEEWSKLPGKTVCTRGTYARIEAIGHIVKDDWFEPSALEALFSVKNDKS